MPPSRPFYMGHVPGDMRGAIRGRALRCRVVVRELRVPLISPVCNLGIIFHEDFAAKRKPNRATTVHQMRHANVAGADRAGQTGSRPAHVRMSRMRARREHRRQIPTGRRSRRALDTVAVWLGAMVASRELKVRFKSTGPSTARPVADTDCRLSGSCRRVLSLRPAEI